MEQQPKWSWVRLPASEVKFLEVNKRIFVADYPLSNRREGLVGELFDFFPMHFVLFSLFTLSPLQAGLDRSIIPVLLISLPRYVASYLMYSVTHNRVHQSLRNNLFKLKHSRSILAASLESRPSCGNRQLQRT